MPPSAETTFAQRYEDALRRHLRRKPAGLQTSRSGRALGREAATLGLDAAALARLHDHALSAIINPAAPRHTHPSPEELTAPAAFFLEVLHPLDLTPSPGAARREAEARIAHDILLAQEAERMRCSRQLGDEITQILAGAHLHLSALAIDGRTRYRSEQKAVARTQHLIDRSMSALHRLARQLHPAMLENLGLLPTLRALVADLFKGRGETVEFSATEEPRQLNPLQRTVLYRVALEALTNVIRHAGARLVRLSVDITPRAVVLRIRDDGQAPTDPTPFAARSARRLGLKGMRERVELIGGLFSLVSTPGAGTDVRAEIPNLAPA